MQGNQYAPNFQYLSLRFQKCTNSSLDSSCADPTSIQTFLDNTRVNIFYSNSMFNASNIEQPILATLSDKTYSAFLPSYSKTLDIFL